MKIPETKAKLVTGEVSEDGLFLANEQGSDLLHVAWWSKEEQRWTCEIDQSRFDVGELTIIAKIEIGE